MSENVTKKDWRDTCPRCSTVTDPIPSGLSSVRTCDECGAVWLSSQPPKPPPPEEDVARLDVAVARHLHAPVLVSQANQLFRGATLVSGRLLV